MPAKGTKRIGEATWGGMRDEYVTGDESLAKIAKRYGYPLKTVERRALDRHHPANMGQTWGEQRTDFRMRVSDEVEQKTIAIASRTLAEVREKSLNVSKLALEELERRLTRKDDEQPVLIETRDLVQAAKISATIKIELSGDPDGAPVKIERKLDELSIEDLRKLAGDGS